MYGGSGYDDGGYGQYGYGGPYGDGGQYGYGPYGGYGYGGYPPPPPKPPRRTAFLSHLLVAVLAAGVAAGVVLAVTPDATTSTPAAGSGGSASQLPNGTVPSLPGNGAPSGNSVPSAAEQAVINKVKPGIVLVNTSLQYDSDLGAGTGMVISPDGVVLTNNHVIEGATKISATVVSTGKTYPAKVVGYDKTGDVSVIKLQGASGLHTVPLGNSASVRSGTSVVALGNANGQSEIVPASGQVTGVNKSITASDPGGTITSEKLHGMLRTNVDIVRGDSGGPLSDTNGQVIGMDTAGYDGNAANGPSTGFAIPIATALSIARQIEAGQASSTITIGYPPFMGIFVAQGSSSNPKVQAQQQNQGGLGNGFGGFGGSGSGVPGGSGGKQSCATSNANLTLPSKIAPVSSGSLVDGAICGSPAAAAGLTGGSVITAVNGQPVGAPDNLTGMLAKYHPGQTISVSWVSPSGHHTTSSIHLVAGPPQ